MANGTNSVETNLAHKKGISKSKNDQISSANPSQNIAKPVMKDAKANANKRMVTRSVSRSMVSEENQLKFMKGQNNIIEVVAKRELSNALGNFPNSKIRKNNPKKFHMSVQIPKQLDSSVIFKGHKLENMDDGDLENVYQCIPHTFADGDVSANQMFSCHLSNSSRFSYISHSQLNLQSLNNTNETMECNDYVNVSYDNAFGPCSISNIHDSNNGNCLGTEYVNPNAVLPISSYSYSPRLSKFSSTQKHDRPINSTDYLLCDNNDVLNNNS